MSDIRRTTLAFVVVIGSSLLAPGSAVAAVINFDSITTNDPTDDTVPQMTGGFDFGPDAFSLISDSEYTGSFANDGDANTYNSPSGAYAAFNSNGTPFLLISRPTRFNFVGANFTSFVESNAYQDFSARTITLTGYRGFQPVGTVTAALSSTAYSFVSANFTDVDQVSFDSSGPAADATYYVVDDFTFSEVPEPGGVWALMAITLGQIGRRRRGLSMERR